MNEPTVLEALRALPPEDVLSFLDNVRECHLDEFAAMRSEFDTYTVTRYRVTVTLPTGEVLESVDAYNSEVEATETYFNWVPEADPSRFVQELNYFFGCDIMEILKSHGKEEVPEEYARFKYGVTDYIWEEFFVDRNSIEEYEEYVE